MHRCEARLIKTESELYANKGSNKDESLYRDIRSFRLLPRNSSRAKVVCQVCVKYVRVIRNAFFVDTLCPSSKAYIANNKLFLIARFPLGIC